jgi:hypothetical protein
MISQNHQEKQLVMRSEINSSKKDNSMSKIMGTLMNKSQKFNKSNTEKTSFSKGNSKNRSYSSSCKFSSNSNYDSISRITNEKPNFSSSTEPKENSKNFLKKFFVKNKQNFFSEDSDSCFHDNHSKATNSFPNDPIYEFYSKLRKNLKPLKKP